MSREARLKPECASLYPALCSGRWEPAAVVVECLIANLLLREQATVNAILAVRRLNPQHFDFRDAPAPSTRPDATDAPTDRPKPDGPSAANPRNGASRREVVRSRLGRG